MYDTSSTFSGSSPHSEPSDSSEVADSESSDPSELFARSGYSTGVFEPSMGSSELFARSGYSTGFFEPSMGSSKLFARSGYSTGVFEPSIGSSESDSGSLRTSPSSRLRNHVLRFRGFTAFVAFRDSFLTYPSTW